MAGIKAIQKIIAFFRQNSCIVHIFVIPLQRQNGKTTSFDNKKTWRGGRVVDCTGLENRRTERYRGFESLSLRFKADFTSKSAFFYLYFPTV